MMSFIIVNVACSRSLNHADTLSNLINKIIQVKGQSDISLFFLMNWLLHFKRSVF